MRRGERLAASIGALTAVLVLSLTTLPADASQTYPFKELFGSAAQPSFPGDRGIAMDHSSGVVLVLDATEDEVRRYNLDGTAANFAALGSNAIDGEGVGDGTPDGNLNFPGSRLESQIAIDNSGGATDGNIYVTERPRDQVSIFAASGEYLGELTTHSGGNFNEPLGVAVDEDGNVYVGDFSGADLVHKYEPAGSFPVNGDHVAAFNGLLGASSIGTLVAGAGPTAGFIFVNRFNGEMFKLDDTTGEVKYQVTTGASTAFVDPAAGHVYVARGTAASSTIDKYDASGAAEADLIASFTPGSTAEGVAASEGGTEVYLSRASIENVEVYGPQEILPDVTTEAPSGLSSTAATLNGAVDPDGLEVDQCFFEWGLTAEYGNVAPCDKSPAEIGAGPGAVAVSADLAGLELATVYHYRLVAINSVGEAQGDDETLLTLGPSLGESWSEDVVVTEAVLKAEVNPRGKATSYRFEYGTEGPCSANPCASTPVPDGAVGSDNSVHEVSRFLSGLAAGTTYHYRVVASNEDAVNQGPDRTFTTYAPFTPMVACPNQDFRFGASGRLPDCRAYELVSPIDKNGGDIATAEQEAGIGSHISSAYRQVSIVGGKITFSSSTAFGDSIGGHFSNQYVATRSTNGWSTHAISARRVQNVEEPTLLFLINPRWHTYGFFQGFSPDLSSAWVRDDNIDPLSPEALEGYANLYRRDNDDDGYEALTRQEPLVAARSVLSRDEQTNIGGPRVLGASEDLRHQVFVVNAALTPDASFTDSEGARNAQLYDLVEGQLHLVSVLPDGEAAGGNSFAGTASAGRYVETHQQMLKNAVSADGSRIVWTHTPGGSTGGPGAIYVRENPGEEQTASGACDEPGKACTIAVSESVSAGASQFWAASDSGSHVLFSQGSHPNRSLHLFDVDTQTPTPIAGEVLAAPGSSEDLTRVYFVSREDLDGGGPAQGSELNLYVHEEGASEFIGALAAADVEQLSENLGGSGIRSANALGVQTLPSGAPVPIYNQTRATPDGRHFTFMSNSAELSQAVAGYDNSDVLTGDPVFEVYRYDAVTASLACISCKPSGARPRGHLVRAPYSPVEFEFASSPHLRVGGSIPSHEHDNYASRVISDNGNRVYFHSDDALLPRDTNGVQDLYQWQAEGSSGCRPGANGHSAQNKGCISLISTGRDGSKSEFVDATPSGDEVYFTTDESIDPRDPGLRDVYVAKVGGGFPLLPPTAPCEGEACQSPPPPPESADPASASFSGPGDPLAAGPSCNALARRAKRLSNRAQRQRRAARRSQVQGKSRKMRRGARRSARRARAFSKRAKRCRARKSRGANTSRRAGR